MTSQNTKIKELLNQIDVLLDKTPPRLPWVMAGDVDQQRKILEETRDYLRSLEPQITAREGYAAPPALSGYSAPALDAGAGESAQQVLQAVLQEMNYLRSSVMQTMRSDIDSLQQQRDTLAQEVRFLEAQRQQYLMPQQQMNQQLINDFLQSLMGRLQENLTEQVAQMMMNMQLEQRGNVALEGQPYPSLPGGAQPNAALPGSAMTPGLLTPSQRLEHMQRVQAQSDQLLLKLDSTLKVIFESLHQNLQGYEESLGQGLDKMHRLGQQGEAMFAALVNRLAQQLGRDASAYLQSSIESSVWEAAAPFLPPDAPSARSESSDAVTESQIDYLLNQLNRPQVPNQTTTEPDLSLALENVELETEPPIFDLPDDDGQLTLFQNESGEPDAGELTLLQTDEPVLPEPILPEPEEIVDLDAAFDLLNQFSDEHSEPAEPAVEASAPVETPESLYGELDLYESMFGAEGNAADTSISDVAPDVAEVEQRDDAAIAYSTDEAFPNEFEEALFDGLVDPAQPTVDEAAPDLSEADEEISVTTSYLFGETDEDLDTEGWLEIPEDELTTAALFDVEPQEFEAEPEEPAETISSLADLTIPTETVEAGSDSPDEGTLLEDDTLLDESYEAAAADEDLLEPDQPIESTPFDLTLTSNTLNQLSADLSNLEGLAVEGPDVERPEAERVEERDDWELSDFAVTAPPDEPLTLEPPTPTLDAPTDEVLAEYFSGFDADEGFALPEQPTVDDANDIDLLFADTPDLSTLLEEEPISPEELESLEADDEEFELPAIELDESEFSDAEALKALLADDDADWNALDPAIAENGADDQPLDDDDELLAAVRSSNDETIPGVDAMLPSPTEDIDPSMLLSSVDASIDALPNLYNPDDLPFTYGDVNPDTLDDGSANASREAELEADLEGLQDPHPSSPDLPLDMTGDSTLQDLFGQPEFDQSDESEPVAWGDETTPSDAVPIAEDVFPFTLDNFSDSLDEPAVTSEANLDEYEVVGNSYASFLGSEPSIAQDSLEDWLGETEEPLEDLEPEFENLSSEPVASGPASSPEQTISEHTLDDLFATDDPDELFEVDALIEQVEQEDEANAFTLEGLGSLFEDLPDYEPDVYPIPSPGNPKTSNGQMPEGTFVETDPSTQAETPEKKSPSS